MQDNGLELAEQKTEAIVFTRRYTRNKMQVRCGNAVINSKKSVKYLGFQMDQKLLFQDHAIEITKKTLDFVKKLGYILPNIGGAKELRRRLLSTTAMSRILYGAPCWSTSMGEVAWKKLEAVQRRTCLMTVAAYRTVSYASISVVASMPPLILKAKESTNMFNNRNKTESNEKMLKNWQEDWDTATQGRWTHQLIPSIKAWVSRRHGEVNFHLT